MTNGNRPRRIAVVGGGVSGLAAAYTLTRARQAGAPIEEVLLEAKDRLGGVIRTERVDGFVIEAGPDSFLEQKPEAAALCRELGLGDELIGSNDEERRTYILHGGRLVPLPDGLLLLVPTRIWPMVTTPLLPLRSKLAIAFEWFASPSDSKRADESVASFVRRHFGEAMLENIADPLLAGVYGGDSGALSVRSVLPRFWEMERTHGSLTRATLRAMRERKKRNRKQPAATDGDEPGQVTGAVKPPPLFMTLRNGLDGLTGKLTEQLDPSRVLLERRVEALESLPGNNGGNGKNGGRRYLVRCNGNQPIEVDAVILAMPTHECSRLLAPFDPALGESLDSIPYSSSVTVSLAYDAGAREALPPGFGFLAPRKENRRMLACTFVHTKFRDRVPEGKALLRCFLGGARDPEVLNLSDDELVFLARKELQEILNFSREPSFHRVHRWPRAMAQYVVGHMDRVNKIQAGLENLPGIFLAGNAYSGIGISDCVRTGRAAAQHALGTWAGAGQQGIGDR